MQPIKSFIANSKRIISVIKNLEAFGEYERSSPSVINSSSVVEAPKFNTKGAIDIPNSSSKYWQQNGSLSYNEGQNRVWSSNLGDRVTLISNDQALGYYQGFMFSLIKAIADDISNIELNLYIDNQDEEGRENFIEIKDDEVFNSILAGNERFSFNEIMSLYATHMKIFGECFMYLGDVSSYDEAPRMTMPIASNKVILNYKYTRNLEEYFSNESIESYTLTVGGKSLKVPPYQIWHIKQPDPLNHFQGTSEVKLLAHIADAFNNVILLNKRRLENGAFQDYFIKTPFTNEDQNFVTELQFSQKYAGSDRAGKVGTLPLNSEIIKIGMTNQEMSFEKLIDFLRDQLKAGFGVSDVILGRTEGTQNRAVAEVADAVFTKRVITPLMKRFVDSFNTYMTPRFRKDKAFIGFDSINVKDKEYELAFIDKLSDKVITINEARADLGREPIDGGDSLSDLQEGGPGSLFGGFGKDYRNSGVRLKKSFNHFNKIRRKNLVGRYIPPNKRLFSNRYIIGSVLDNINMKFNEIDLQEEINKTLKDFVNKERLVEKSFQENENDEQIMDKIDKVINKII